MYITLGWLGSTNVPLKAVPSVEEFADVSASIMLKNKLTSWMELTELCGIDDKFVNDHKKLSLCHSLFKVCSRDSIFNFFQRDIFMHVDLIDGLSN